MHLLCGKDEQVFPELGAVAERCGHVTVQSSFTKFYMVLRLEIPTPLISQWHCYNGSTVRKQFSHNNIDGGMMPTWKDDNYRSFPKRPNNNYPVCKKNGLYFL